MHLTYLDALSKNLEAFLAKGVAPKYNSIDITYKHLHIFSILSLECSNVLYKWPRAGYELQTNRLNKLSP